MSDTEVIKRILESKSEQKLRDSINDGKDFKVESSSDATVLQNYEQMDESAKQQFTRKGWVND